MCDCNVGKFTLVFYDTSELTYGHGPSILNTIGFLIVKLLLDTLFYTNLHFHRNIKFVGFNA